MNPVRITAPTDPVVTLTDLKQHLRVLHSDDDDLITAYEAAAVSWLDGYSGVLGRAILSQGWQESFPAWGCMRLALPDVSAAAVSYKDAAGTSQTVPDATLRFDGSVVIIDATGPADASDITVVYTCALPAGDLPAIVQAVKMLVAHWYVRREAVGEAVSSIPFAAEVLINHKRRRQL
ncbi:hypothetical protein CG51_17885 [Haematobacter missouriensis]|uniref:Phage gp6-like head-tail connector protein n=1 Tax=Haematobacter missouriensis TaxID=366616 RepID=A0A212AHV1_9RHOB|nr:head-tail connector protein [Haematobacter missouriensis]KFI24516.1 hypothetical protein CG51_17885 [Haematobacter missouriensis]OWJ70992.1 hypothetical protein CDV53_19795 [Haematobacter missouriensis]OWJ81082.1 hypothetical protein CDV52_19570 [Haematobacter missouriensis]